MMEYSVFLEDDTQVDTNVGKEPLSFLYGSGQILPGLEEKLSEMDIGDHKRIILDPEHAYGIINPTAFKEVDATLIPENLRYEGAVLVISDESFGEMMIRVDALKEDKVVLDFNHPLAGKTLTFDVKILNIQ